MTKYAKNRNYVPPSKGKTVLVHPSKDKDGVVKQDWDVYIGHGLNNKHSVLEKSKWSNPFYTPKLSAKICNKIYRRHILSSKHLQGSFAYSSGCAYCVARCWGMLREVPLEPSRVLRSIAVRITKILAYVTSIKSLLYKFYVEFT